jgi:Fanconi anemia group M protein
MAPTKPLVLQHRKSFLKILKFQEKDLIMLTGETPPHYRRTLWESGARIFFSTPQVVRNDLIGQRFSLEKYGLVVFDECHRAVKKYAYTDIARFYVSQSKYPIILGMTASPGSDQKKVLEVCRNLYAEQVEYRNEENPDVKPYIQPIKVEWKKVNLPKDYLEIRFQIRSMLNKKLKWLYQKGVIKRTPKYVNRRNLIEAGKRLRLMLEKSIKEERGKIFTAIIYQSLSLSLFHMYGLLETQGLHTLKAFINKLEIRKGEKRSYAILTNDPEYKKIKAFIEQNYVEHPKAELLKQIIEQQVKKKPSSRMLVFTQYRDTANHLVEELNSLLGVKADKFVGQASKRRDKGLTQSEQAQRIKMLVSGELNVLVATSIAEEGLDIPAVDHVFFYEPIPSEIRYIQRRGRTGRKTPGKVTILVTAESLDMIYLYASKRKTDKMKYVVAHINSKLQPSPRKNPKPPLNPLTNVDLNNLDKQGSLENDKLFFVRSEKNNLKDLQRKIEHIKQNLYMCILGAGATGINIDQMANHMQYKDISILRATVRRFVEEGLITEINEGYYVVTPAAQNTQNKTYRITIEKIFRKGAIVKVNDKWIALLTPEQFVGPKALIKKNSKFEAIADLYNIGGKLHIRINDVIKITEK